MTDWAMRPDGGRFNSISQLKIGRQRRAQAAGGRRQAQKAMALARLDPALRISNLEHPIPLRRPEDLSRLAA